MEIWFGLIGFGLGILASVLYWRIILAPLRDRLEQYLEGTYDDKS
jgi:hypothetical protein